MCGRYGLNVTEQQLFERYHLENDAGFAFDDKNEIFPTTSNPVLLPDHKFYDVKWGFTPSFAKRPLINARAESVLAKKTFREPFTKKRCIVPATHFYEWQKVEGQDKKIKKRILVEDLPIFSMAGICERYKDEKGMMALTYTILTTDANEQMAAIHDRMPVILEPDQEELYLDLSVDPEQIQPLLRSTGRHLIVENVD